MKKILLATAGLAMFFATGALAQVSLDVSIGTPGYIVPAPVVIGQPPIIVNDAAHRHRQDDWRYWQEQKERARWEHDHPGGRWDHDAWARGHR